jgi:hypothetical protein
MFTKLRCHQVGKATKLRGMASFRPNTARAKIPRPSSSHSSTVGSYNLRYARCQLGYQSKSIWMHSSTRTRAEAEAVTPVTVSRNQIGFGLTFWSE